MKNKIKENLKRFVSHIKHCVLTFLYWLYNFSGKKLFKIERGDITMGPGYKRHFLVEDTNHKLYMSDKRRSHIIQLMNKVAENDNPKESPVKHSASEQDDIKNWERKARIVDIDIRTQQQRYEKRDKKEE